MATIRERETKNGKVHYCVIVRIKGYPTQRKTLHSKTQAKQWAQEMEVAIRTGKHIAPTGRKNRTVADMIDRYLEKVLKKDNRQYKTKFGHLRWWREELGEYALNRLSPSILVDCREKLLAERIQKKPRSVATVNRYLATFSLVLNIACMEWEWIDESPMKRVKKYKEPRGRIRYLDDDEKRRLLDVCKESRNSQLYMVVVIALSTGMRLGEILNLTWTDVDLEVGKAVLHETKNGERRVVAIVSVALRLLRKHKAMQQANTLLVFPNALGSGPVNIRRDWERALRESEVENFRFHDLRHTFASYLAMNGASLAELAEALGHKTLAMVKRYAHLSEAHTASVVQRMNDRMLSDEEAMEA